MWDVTVAQIDFINLLFNDLEIETARQKPTMSSIIGRRIELKGDITKDEGSQIIQRLKHQKEIKYGIPTGTRRGRSIDLVKKRIAEGL